ncbi:MAG: hypothetical protein E6L09_13635 [Verrucomicrobia bacterium]|nr:MAG: hypothetical protein E6L09_13635 [Verrucomicrobiota bacterium]
MVAGFLRSVDARVEDCHGDAFAGNAQGIPGRVGADPGVCLGHEEGQLAVGVDSGDTREPGNVVDLDCRGEHPDRVKVVEADCSGAGVLNRARQYCTTRDGRIEVYDPLDLVGRSQC